MTVNLNPEWVAPGIGIITFLGALLGYFIRSTARSENQKTLAEVAALRGEVATMNTVIQQALMPRILAIEQKVDTATETAQKAEADAAATLHNQVEWMRGNPNIDQGRIIKPQ